MRWLDEILEPGQLDFNRFAHQTGLEDPKIARTSGIHSESVGRWPDAFTPDEARLIWSETRELWGAWILTTSMVPLWEWLESEGSVISALLQPTGVLAPI